MEIAEKTNEIPVFQELLSKTGIPHAIFTADALHMQKKTFKIAAANDHKLLIQLKDNQQQLVEDTEQVIKLERPSGSYHEKINKEHGRIEKREATVYHTGIENHILDPDWVQHIKTVVHIKRSREAKNTKSGKWQKSIETALYLSNEKINAELANKLVRDHWSIENKNHHTKDVSFLEDKSKVKNRLLICLS